MSNSDVVNINATAAITFNAAEYLVSDNKSEGLSYYIKTFWEGLLVTVASEYLTGKFKYVPVAAYSVCKMVGIYGKVQRNRVRSNLQPSLQPRQQISTNPSTTYINVSN